MESAPKHANVVREQYSELACHAIQRIWTEFKEAFEWVLRRGAPQLSLCLSQKGRSDVCVEISLDGDMSGCEETSYRGWLWPRREGRF